MFDSIKLIHLIFLEIMCSDVELCNNCCEVGTLKNCVWRRRGRLNKWTSMPDLYNYPWVTKLNFSSSVWLFFTLLFKTRSNFSVKSGRWGGDCPFHIQNNFCSFCYNVVPYFELKNFFYCCLISLIKVHAVFVRLMVSIFIGGLWDLSFDCEIV